MFIINWLQLSARAHPIVQRSAYRGSFRCVISLSRILPKLDIAPPLPPRFFGVWFWGLGNQISPKGARLLWCCSGARAANGIAAGAHPTCSRRSFSGPSLCWYAAIFKAKSNMAEREREQRWGEGSRLWGGKETLKLKLNVRQLLHYPVVRPDGHVAAFNLIVCCQEAQCLSTAAHGHCWSLLKKKLPKPTPGVS